MKIELNGISKFFSHKKVLKNLNLTMDSKNLYTLMGDNGAGKSTLAGIITGAIPPSKGFMCIDGKKVPPKNHVYTKRKGIAIVNQRPLLANSLTIRENIQLGIPRNFLKKNDTEEQIAKLKKKWHITLSLEKKASALSAPERFYTTLLACLIKKPSFLILDEPGASLDENERKVLFSDAKKENQQGLGILIITHNKNDFKNLGSVNLYLKNGIIQENKKNMYKSIPEHLKNTKIECKTTVLSLKNLTLRPINRAGIYNLSFFIRKGEILCLCGKRESGLETLEDFLCGFIKTGKKTKPVMLFNKKTIISSPKILRNKGIGIIPFDKTNRGSNPELTVEQMLCAHLYMKRLSKKIKRKQYAQTLIEKSGIKINPQEKVKNLSGGMLQRLIVARELELAPALLIVSQPLQGMDSFSSQKCCQALEDAACKGSAILVLTTSNSPLLKKAHRIQYMDGGKIRNYTDD